ncbi:MAG: phosphoglucosamine mutase [Zetaproteobacteria bacterium CG_4_9_14_3_um_filter_49_83]|nr:MAG: phosphoglucosamine mutase [Zetaproteobacteria bacterium CG1_02_49_23]PIQ34076.1 MAG: phosphoglucosamine mutase [Zetaproteobacteria bacterium CG17_big_fil_post_rev_8_21_14_2_50_50_13]PIV30247.1 MAG: phosphoglucosamine mutase [Zetaproteobacteria bacterium CG02_land_8_20_14_3_00_50_9]PIY55876.1 MAG: phosphoglucosamine mutase [Zetaproteobacteria bacterium CG_4_10_14_0_8_um_filter_49_80]PJA35006.1 MAG: phosphoglucosamine mutase [Zetaproteobacteria bacterium CG_4_9_14_3_um_filter_49_83]
MRKYFGTDGVRGTVNQLPMTAEFALRLGQAAGYVLTRHLSHKPHILIGKDTRLSGYMIESALCAGLTAQGMNVMLVGPVPTPAVAYLTGSLRADAGVMLSASHNPAGDNGIKFFGADGFKLPDEVELEIEQCLDDLPPLPPALEIGKAVRVDDAKGRYIEFLKASLPRDTRFDGLKVVIDSANGAAYAVAPQLLSELGCEVFSISDRPDGFNINRQCGSTYPESMCSKVKEVGADVGFALDGDADRLIACDQAGNLIDGDKVIAILAAHAHRHGQLHGGAVVTTLMSNMGLERYLESLGLVMHRANVGDRYVLKMMQETGCNIGGEQSGHMILLDFNTTGDGLMTALALMCAMQETQQPIAALASEMQVFPQNLWNIVLSERWDVMSDSTVLRMISAAEQRLSDSGRINVRMSGTEPKLRIMVEAAEASLMQDVGQTLFDEMKTYLDSRS